MSSELLATLKNRFQHNMYRHEGISWEQVATKLQENTVALSVITRMEETGGEPDLVLALSKGDSLAFVDCSVESPIGRRSLCYDRLALDGRKENKPKNSVEDIARDIGIELLNEEEYRTLQTLFPFDLKTSSWIKTPDTIRTLGGALFSDRRYDHVFTYHNGADSYYAARGFRGVVRV